MCCFPAAGGLTTGIVQPKYYLYVLKILQELSPLSFKRGETSSRVKMRYYINLKKLEAHIINN
jgi:hypothetical protein